jgi:hypothetical protein
MYAHLPIVLAISFAMMMGSQAVPATAATPQAASANLVKEVNDHKDAIQWRNAPDTAIPPDVCSIFQACTAPFKFVTLPAATEGGQKIGRGLFWIPAGPKQKADVIILEHQTYSDVYFFLLSPDGKLAKAAYRAPGKAWVPMGNGLAQPTFDKSLKAFQTWVSKMGTSAPKAAAPPATAAKE